MELHAVTTIGADSNHRPDNEGNLNKTDAVRDDFDITGSLTVYPGYICTALIIFRLFPVVESGEGRESIKALSSRLLLLWVHAGTTTVKH